jgi:broad specificity phosphatase PhoE
VDLAEAPEVSEGERATAISFVRRHAGTEVAICTHGDVIAEILVSLADEDRVDLGPNPKQAKGSVWALEGSDSHFTRATYYAPVVGAPS